MSNQTNRSTTGLNSKPARDTLAVALDAVNDRWSLHIVRALAFGASRYTEILRAVGAPRDVLAARLRKLAETGILQARSTEDGKVAGYELTQKGKDLGQVILVLKRWGDTYSDAEVPKVDFIHDVCGEVFVAEVRCQACGRPLRSGELSLDQESAAC
ncbi:helix-turn-helix domain-containing protein [Micromonospora sp. NPDC049114]|uniref:winged helix-turn-helix transcriptional regulator n=1 Tax=unclassified Micromonospora TaxID=2617518 RepID=UPI001F209863|nr:helix-turn-helix domain-containing protein [Micromonospora sp. MH99]MCF0096021.1 putative HTH-type transcriptional regulator [Micromonospora sp. MH99]